jgi:hypothetical protein
MRTVIARLLAALFSLSFSSSQGRVSRWAGRPGNVMTPLPRNSARRCRMARIVLRGCALALAVLAMAALPQRANAQSFTASKNICIGAPGTGSGQVSPTNCQQAAVVGANQPVFYVITVTNLGSAQPINVNETYPSGFTPTAVVCTDQNGVSVTVSLTTPGSFNQFIFPLGQSQTVTCTIAGTFASAVSGVANTATLTGSDGTPVNASVNTFVAPIQPLNTDLSVTKTPPTSSVTLTGLSSSTPGSATVTFTITVANTSPNAQPVSLPKNFALHDTLTSMSGSVPLQVQLQSATCTPSGGFSPLTASFSGSSVLTVMPGSAPVDLVDWGFPTGSSGSIPAGSSITCLVTVKISSSLQCYIQKGDDGLINQAFFTLGNVTNGTTYSDINPANDTALASLSVNTGATTQNSNCGIAQLDLKKTQTSPSGTGNVPWPGPVTYTITITNNSNPQQTITIPAGGLKDIVTEGYGTPPFTGTLTGATCVLSSGGGNCISDFSPTPTASWNSPAYGAQSTTPPPWPWSNTSSPLTLLAGRSVTITLTFTYANTSPCTTVPAVNPEPIINTAIVNYTATPVGQPTGSQTYQQSASVTTNMTPLPACKLVTQKIGSGQPVQFGQQLSYTVIFSNPGAAVTVGTVMDAVRLTDSAYGTPVPYSGTWSCTSTTVPAVTPSLTSKGVPPITGLKGPNLFSGSAIFTPYPPQGSPIFEVTNLFFPPKSVLTCKITITVQQPTVNNPNCSATPTYFENLGLMDVTNPYNPNVKWPPSGTYSTGGSSPGKPITNWATVDAQLPQCYDVIVNKPVSVDGATPAWTTQNGPAVNYQITVTNTGTGIMPLTGQTQMGTWRNGLLLTDDIVNPYYSDYVGDNVTLTNPPCPGTWCTPLIPPGPSPSPSTAGIAKLFPGTSGNWDLTLLVPKSGFVVNTTINDCVNVAPQGTFTGPGWYANYANPQPPPNPPVAPQQACASVPVLATATVDVFKTIVNNTGKTLIGLTTTKPFTGIVSCGIYPLLPSLTPGGGIWTQTDPQSATTLLNGQNVTSQTAAVIQNVPVAANETCTVTEPTNTLPPVPVEAVRACGGSAAWGPPTILWMPGVWTPPTGAWTTSTSAPGMSLPINKLTAGATYSVNVINSLICRPTANLVVTKTVVNNTQQTANIPASPALTFTANISCSPTPLVPSSVNLSLTVGATSATTLAPGASVSSLASLPVAVPVGDNCTVTETTPLPAVPSAVPSGGLCYTAVRYPATWTTTITPTQPIINIAAGGTYAVTITNTLSCNPLTVKKLVRNDTANVASSTQFLVTATCTPPSPGTSYPVYVYGNTTSQAITGLAYASSCTFVETLPPNFTNSGGQICTWQTPQYLPQPLIIGMGPNTETVTNFYSCQSAAAVKPGACPPPMVAGAAPGSCVCPDGMKLQGKECVAVAKTCPPPMISGPVLGSCVCPDGMKLQGKKCVRPIECKPPLIPNAAATECVCPQGTVRKGRDCVRPIQCKPPMIPNAAATACMCPRDTVQRGQECVPMGGGGRPGRGGGGGGGRR